ncbi:MAG: CopG family transcriptional regulator [Clostridia bacterium]|nr:CopG family transcriptional regulator [Clostridia bacterium]MBR2160769.1 CopG family transcriptional regulator [Clostridia bacterium]MBR2324286.1 CopG family transcriptional regulator [Clostridia bacterium]MBR2397990.1 CopG family transcriptional regulator [Clostridia bacterium]MBR2496664.1 CopG family transcriptional regulator [Clostridia bacterium]
MEKRLGVVAIVVEGNRGVAVEVQKVLSEFSDIIIGRMGIPDNEKEIAVISLIIKGTVERISALTGKLGRLENISVKSAITQVAVK